MAMGTRVPHLESRLPVCCSKAPEPLKSIRPLAICCSRGTSTAVSQERDCRSLGSSSSATREEPEAMSLLGDQENKVQEGCGDGEQGRQGCLLGHPLTLSGWGTVWSKNQTLTGSTGLRKALPESPELGLGDRALTRR